HGHRDQGARPLGRQAARSRHHRARIRAHDAPSGRQAEGGVVGPSRRDTRADATGVGWPQDPVPSRSRLLCGGPQWVVRRAPGLAGPALHRRLTGGIPGQRVGSPYPPRPPMAAPPSYFGTPVRPSTRVVRRLGWLVEAWREAMWPLLLVLGVAGLLALAALASARSGPAPIDVDVN